MPGSWDVAESLGTPALPEVGEGGWKTSLVAPGEDHVSALMGESNSGPCFLRLSVPSPTNEKKTRQHLRSAFVFLGTS